MISLDRSADLPFLVRTFEMNLVNNLPTRTYYLLSERALIVSFTTLVVELPNHHSPTWAYEFLQPHDVFCGAGFSTVLSGSVPVREVCLASKSGQFLNSHNYQERSFLLKSCERRRD